MCSYRPLLLTLHYYLNNHLLSMFRRLHFTQTSIYYNHLPLIYMHMILLHHQILFNKLNSHTYNDYTTNTSSININNNKTIIATNIVTKNFIFFCILLPPKYYFFFLKAKEYIKIIAIPTSKTMTIMVPALTPDFSS